MIVLIIGLILFFTVHSISIISLEGRDKLIARLGEGAYKGLYSLCAAIGLGLIIWGYGLARSEAIVVWVPPMWLRHVSLLLLLPIFVFLIATYLPGKIKAILKHPMLVATKLWALAHLLANGMLADVLLFGSFLVWAIVDRISVKRRPQRATPTLPAGKLNDVIAVVGGLGLYVAFALWFHVWLIGVPPVTVAG